MGTGMGTDSVTRRYANDYRKRTVAGIMNYCERQPWWSKLSHEEQRALRSAVYDKTNSYHDFIMTVINVTEQDERNPAAVEALAAVVEGQARIERAVTSLGARSG